MRIGKFFTLATFFVAAFMLGSCSKDDDEEENSKFENHEYVDLGLPSGTLWATCNVGASKPEEYGDYFAWGETEPKEIYSFSTYKWCNGSYDTRTKYCTDSEYGIVDNKTVLDPEDDAATVNWGSSWCMPSIKKIEELYSYTTTKDTTINGVNGLLITSNNNDETLFLPAAGWRIDAGLEYVNYQGNYWSRSLDTEYNHPIDMFCTFHGFNGYGGSNRPAGFSVRPVRAKK